MYERWGKKATKKGVLLVRRKRFLSSTLHLRSRFLSANGTKGNENGGKGRGGGGSDKNEKQTITF